MRKSILRFGALALMSAVSIGAFATDFFDNGNKYEITKADPDASGDKVGELKLVKFHNTGDVTDAMKVIGNVIITNSYSGEKFKCTAISADAFKNMTDENVTITIGQHVTEIAANAFSNIDKPISIAFSKSESLQNIGKEAFKTVKHKNAAGTNDVLAQTVTFTTAALDFSNAILSDGAFCNVVFAANTVVELGAKETIPANLFKNTNTSNTGVLVTNNLAKVHVNGTSLLTSVGASAFEGCLSLTEFGYEDGVTGHTSVFLPSNLETVGENAFMGCNAITSFQFSNAYADSRIKKVGAGAFSGCSWINNAKFVSLFPATTLTETEGVKVGANLTFGNASFAGTGLTGKLDVTDVNYVDNVYTDAFKGCASITRVVLPTTNKITAIADNAFEGCSDLQTVDHFENVTTIGASAFADCTELGTTYDSNKEFDLFVAKNLTKIEAKAFMNTENFLTVNIPNKVEFIGEDAFTREDETTLEDAFKRNIYIIAKETTSPTEISDKVIKSSISYTQSNNTYYVATAPIANYAKTDLHVPMGLMNEYALPVGATASIKDGDYYNWSGAANGHLYTNAPSKNEGDKIYIGPYLFTVVNQWSNQYQNQNSPEVPTVKLAKINVKQGTGDHHDDYTPYKGTLYNANTTNHVSQFDLVVPQTICNPGENDEKTFVWYNVTAVEKMSAIGDGAVTDLSKNVESAKVQADKIDLSNVFSSCSNLTSFEFCALPDMKNAYYQDENHKVISEVGKTGWAGAKAAPKEAKIGEYAFNECTSLDSFAGVDKDNFTYTGNTVGQQAFYNCKHLDKIVIPNAVWAISWGAYYGTAITEVDLPDALLQIRGAAFGNTGLTTVEIPKKVTFIGANAFDGSMVGNEFKGVRDVFVNWADPDDEESSEVPTCSTSAGIHPQAFGDAAIVPSAVNPEFVLRRLYIPAGSADSYPQVAVDEVDATTHVLQSPLKFTIAEAIILKKVDDNTSGRMDITIHPTTGARSLEIEDNSNIAEFRIGSPAEDVAVTYKRHAVTGMPNPLFVPFAFQGKGNGYQIYQVFDTKIVDNEDGTASESIEYVQLGESDMTVPNVPYIFVPTQDVVTFETVGYAKTTAPASLADAIFTVEDVANKYAFYGTYNIRKANELVTVGSGQYPFYALSNNSRFVKLSWIDDDPSTTEVDETKHESAKALRFFMTKIAKTNPYSPASDNVKIILLDDEDVTAIEALRAGNANAPMFDLQGRQITSPVKGQVYIQNGLKKLAR